ncbi:2-amino-4-hydroxy-6-hydroxymethyldihydropteridine diphosphokinase [Candidatus Igneacidithiobacillus taiwanensis]|uniref:2-amino-4-hydroxy-6- hydroxymethyldihydropteridine diphosphokinase n=1 Tax=Candidatus Igneacidithiobacillus taiwanensis TaxID=1945924 RepID=UPI00289DDE76|nr:2-amino-4-hydroxy-6-hydroxymethyldihydropteridine diphosphokinase [Candidatus Igneacidithiobacillus taiwanensis]
MAERTESAAVIAWIGIGSNLAEPRLQVARARLALAELPDSRLDWVSDDYWSEPVGGVVQDPFVNAVARLETRLPAEQLLPALHLIEAKAGRRRAQEQVWGPRILDLDLLLYGELQSQEPRLRLPHPEIARRAFVLRPLADYDPELLIPGLGKVSALLPAVAMQRLWRISGEAGASARIGQAC